MVYFAYIFACALILSPLALWVCGRYFSYKAMDEMTKRLPEEINKEVHLALWVEYKVGIPGLFWWRMGFQTKPFQDEPFEPHEDIYDEERLSDFTEELFKVH